MQKTAAKYGMAQAKKQAEDDIDVRYATKAHKVAEKEYELNQDLDRKRKGAVPFVELERLRLDAERAALAIEKAGRSRGLAYARALEAGSGTNLEEALRFALGDLKSPERLQMVVVLTAGMPTIGVTSPGEIMKSIKKANSHKRRLFVFGVGQNLNAKLLDRIAGETRGATEYIRDRENIELRLSAFYDKIDLPVLTDLRIEFPDGGVSDVFPRDMPDLFHGVQLSLFGRYQPGQ